MATKKAAPKKAAKAAAPAKKAPAKPAAFTSTKPAPPKAAAKKAAPAKAEPKKAAATPAAKKVAVPAKSVKIPEKAIMPEKNTISAPAAKATPEKKPVAAEKATPVKASPAKSAAPVKKPSVDAPTQTELKPAIKPLQKPAKKEAAKPFVIPKTSTNKAVKYEPEFTKSVLDAQNHEPSGPTMRYSDAELQEFRDLINRKLDTAKKELAYLQGLITRKDESGDLDEGRYMTMEDGSMSMEREQLSQMASRQIQFIDHLEKAVMRIENKTYGVCRVTGKLIDKARLRAVPHATLSIEAKQMMNK